MSTDRPAHIVLIVAVPSAIVGSIGSNGRGGNRGSAGHFVADGGAYREHRR
jgi:hypothetical protein